MPKLRVDSKLEDRANDAAQVVAEHLAQNLVDLRGRRLSANARAELGLNHVERRFYIRPLMVVLEEFFAVVGEKVEHALPEGATIGRVTALPVLGLVRPVGSAAGLKRNERKRARRVDSVEVVVADIGAVGSEGLNGEPLSRRLEEGG